MSWKQSGYTIDVNNAGAFTADVEGTEITGNSLQECRAKIEAEIVAGRSKKKIQLPVIGFLQATDHYGVAQGKDKPREYEIVHTLVVGVNRNTRELLCADVPKGYEIACIMPDTVEAHMFLKRYIAFRKEERLVRSVMPNWMLGTHSRGRVEAGKEYNELVDELVEQHKRKKEFRLETFLQQEVK